MPTVDLVKVQSLIRAQLLTVAGITKDLVAWENEDFTPPEPNPPSLWYREFPMPGSMDLVATGTTKAIGVLQYEALYPRSNGAETPKNKATAMADVFAPPLQLGDSTIQVNIYKAVVGKGYNDHDQEIWYAVPVLIYYRCFALN